MDMQALAVAVIVVGCMAYAAWTLMPSALRRVLASALLTLRWPPPLQRLFQRAARRARGCGECGGCDSAGAQPGSQRVTWHPPSR